MRDNFGGRVPSWARAGARKTGGNYELSVKAGDVIEATVAGSAASSGPDARR